MKEKIVLRVGSQVDDLSMSALFGGVGAAVLVSSCTSDLCTCFGSNCFSKCITNCRWNCNNNCENNCTLNCGSNCACNCGVNDTAKCPKLLIQGPTEPVSLGF